MEKAQPLELFGFTIAPGTRQNLSIPVARLYTDTPIDLRIEVIHGRKKGPCLLVCAAIHGDELNGVEICRQLLGLSQLARIYGTLIIIPVVNQLGFIHQTRYLPDRRDLNRCFPGSSKGSLGSRLANLITTGLFPQVDYALDLHTGALHRANLPQIRTDLSNPESLQLARAFGAPVLLHAALRDGSFRHAANEYGIPVLVYEGGEALRLDQASIKLGVRGVLRVMRQLRMLRKKVQSSQRLQPWECSQSYWLRSSRNGLVILHIKQGQQVAQGEMLASVVNPFDPRDCERVCAPYEGVVIGLSRLPLANEGDALVHLAKTSSTLADTEYDQGIIEEVLDTMTSTMDGLH